MDDKLFGFLTTTGGLVIGWSFNELSGFIKAYRAQKKIFRQILYTQLEIRNIILKTDVAGIQSKLSPLLSKGLGGFNDPEEVQKAINHLFGGFIQEQQQHHFGKSIKELITSYSANMKELAAIDPFTTFHIAQKDATFDYLSSVDEYLKSLTGHLSGSNFATGLPPGEAPDMASLQVLMLSLKSQLTPLMRASALETIEDDMKAIAAKIGLLMRFRIYRFIKTHQNQEINATDEQRLQTLFTNMMAQQPEGLPTSVIQNQSL